MRTLKAELEGQGYRSKIRKSTKGNITGGNRFQRGALYTILKNRIYLGEIAHKEKSYPGEHEDIVDGALWDRVQETLGKNRIDRKRAKGARESSPLAGILFDDQGQRLTPNHANKGERRYRYYVGGASGMRLPAAELENAVLSEIARFLNTPSELVGSLAHVQDDATTQQRLAEQGRQKADTVKASGLKDLVPSILQRVEIGKQSLTLMCSRSGLRQGLMGKAEDPLPTDEFIKLTASFTRRRRGIETKLILGNGTPDQESVLDPALIKAMARAHVWNQKVITGKAVSVRVLAAEEGVTHGYIRKLLPLAFLAPDIMGAILEGRQPRDLSLKTVLEAGIPDAWDAQRRTLGF